MSREREAKSGLDGPGAQGDVSVDATWDALAVKENVGEYLRSLPDACFINTGPPAKRRKKVLILDLDGILVHSTLRPRARYDFVVEYYVNGKISTHFVTLRPHARIFLRTLAKWYKIYLYTTAEAEYASIVADRLEVAGRVFAKKLYREDCDHAGDKYTKNFAKFAIGPERLVILDNEFVAHENKLLIEPFEGDPFDESLLTMLALLDGLRCCEDVRSIFFLMYM